MNKTTLFLFLIFSSLSNIIAQTWPKVYINPYDNTIPFCAFETYDDGIAILSCHFGESALTAGWLIKTDINGEVLWERSLGSRTDYYSWFNMM